MVISSWNSTAKTLLLLGDELLIIRTNKTADNEAGLMGCYYHDLAIILFDETTLKVRKSFT